MNERTKLQTELAELVAAGFPAVYVETAEHDEAQAEIIGLCTQEGWNVAAWDCAKGLQSPSGETLAEDSTDPVAALAAARALATDDTPGLLILHNFHRLWQSAEVCQAASHAIREGKQHHAHLIVLAPRVEIPAELERLVVTLGHELPGREQLAEIGRGIAQGDEYPSDPGEERQLLDAAAGLTRSEAEGAYSLSIIRHGRLTPAALWEHKTAALRKSGLLTLHRGGETFDGLGGLEPLKRRLLRSLDPNRPPEPELNPRGCLLVGVPGTGKSAIAKALGAETNRPTLHMDIGRLMGSLVGQTEGNVRQALAIADAMAPCVLFVDELEKALAGAGSGAGDSGVAFRLLGTLLSWLQDHKSDVYMIATSNDVSSLPPEFSRPGRFDNLWFLDYPTEEQRETIWQIHLARWAHYVDPGQPRPDDTNWTGAEIEACVKNAARTRGADSLIDAAVDVVPVSAMSAERLEGLRQWASGRCLDAERGGRYLRDANAALRRAINRPTTKPSSN